MVSIDINNVYDEDLQVIAKELNAGAYVVDCRDSEVCDAIWLCGLFFNVDKYRDYKDTLNKRVIFDVLCNEVIFALRDYDDYTVDVAFKILCKHLDNVSAYYARDYLDFTRFILEELNIPADVIKYTDLHGYYDYALAPFYQCVECDNGYIYYTY